MPCLPFGSSWRRRRERCFPVSLSREAESERFGLIVTHSNDGLLVKEISSDSLASRVEVPLMGCCIVTINGRRDVNGMLHHLGVSQDLEMLVSPELTERQQATLRHSQKSTLPMAVLEGCTELVNAEKDTCAICLDEMEQQAMRLPCGHCFHPACAKTWLVTRSRKCPLCNQTVS